MIIKNATIESTYLGYSGDVLIGRINVVHEGFARNFGGYTLYNPNWPDQDFTGKFIHYCLRIADVKDWNELINRPIRIRIEDGRIVAIGHYMEDKWFEPIKDLVRGNTN